MPTIYIDNKPFAVKAGKNLLEACLALGVDLPYFCWHPALGSVGACRQCAVKVFKDEADTRGRLVMSCMEEVREGLRLSVQDKAARAFREQVIEWLMTNHPHDCPVCDEGGSCHLQDMTVMTGHDYRRYRFKKRTYRNQYLGPLIHHEMNRCIQCYRCVRYYRDYAGGVDLNVFAAHHHVYFGREKDGVLQSPFSGNLAEVCPTGVFTDKTLKEHYTRKWDLTMAPSICQHCSVGCNTIAGERYGELRCVLNRYNSEVNGYFLCDRGRFGYEYVNSENRVARPLVRSRMIESVNELELTSYLRAALTAAPLIGIGSPRASLESNFALRQLVGADNFYGGISGDEAYLAHKVERILASGEVHPASLKDIEEADAVVVLGEDIWNTAPMMALAVRQAVRRTAAGEAAAQVRLPLWQDAAIKELVQEDKGFLALVAPAASPLDEMASLRWHMAPDDVARLAFAVAHELNPYLAAVPGADEDLLNKAKAVAEALRAAKRPVIISGTGCYSEGVLKAAFDMAASLNTLERQAGLAYVLPEANSMGLAMLQAPSFEQALARVRREEGLTALILENDLYRYTPAAGADEFFQRCDNVIVLDALHSRTTEKANVLLPAATFAEGDGTLVNYEGRAQRFYQVYMPANAFIKESWKWLEELRALRLQGGNGHDTHPDSLLDQLETALPQFSGVSRVAPRHDFSIHGARIPRETHRYSGRTAMLANLQVSEPRPPGDDDSPLSFTMEGYKGLAPSAAIPFFWSPGWNSVQAVTKYQEEPGGPLRGGDPGVRLFRERTGAEPSLFREVPEAFKARPSKWLLLPRHHVLGSGELSSYTRALAALSPPPAACLSVADAAQLGVQPGGEVSIKVGEQKYRLPLEVNEQLPPGVVLVSAGVPGAPVLNWGEWVRVEKEESP
ncbi:MAG TPA: NADH-quinone oxidoreductase subunit NuoG [Chitinophagaceae bacterium]